MSTEKQFTVADNLTVTVEPNKEHEFLMTTNEVAKGYGVAGNTIRTHKLGHQDELIEGKHFITVENTKMNGVGKTNSDRESATYKQTLWTKRGIVRLGFFIKSERAKLFRDWAEDLVDLLADVAKIDDKELRLSIVNKLINTNHEKKD